MDPNLSIRAFAKAKEHWETAVVKGVGRSQMYQESLSLHDVDSAYRESLEAIAQGRQDATRRDSLVKVIPTASTTLSDYNPRPTEYFWSGQQVENEDKTGHAGKVRHNPSYALAELIRRTTLLKIFTALCSWTW